MKTIKEFEDHVKSRLVTDWESLEGKTIKKVTYGYRTRCIVFTDGTIAIVTIADDYDSSALSLSIDIKEIEEYLLVETGIVTTADVKKYQRQKTASWDKATKENRRKQYEILKAEFENE